MWRIPGGSGSWLCREGLVANRPLYLALGVTVDGEHGILGWWAGEHGDGEGAKFWLRVLTQIKNRGTGTCACWSAGSKAGRRGR